MNCPMSVLNPHAGHCLIISYSWLIYFAILLTLANDIHPNPGPTMLSQLSIMSWIQALANPIPMLNGHANISKSGTCTLSPPDNHSFHDDPQAVWPPAHHWAPSHNLLEVGRTYGEKDTSCTHNIQYLVTVLQKLLIIAGDVETNPGPKWPCGICSESVSRSKNQWSIKCVDCEKWMHRECANLTVQEIKELQKFRWHCGCESSTQSNNTGALTDSINPGHAHSSKTVTTNATETTRCIRNVNDVKRNTGTRWPCGICTKPVARSKTQWSIKCVDCAKWMHRECARLTIEEIKELQNYRWHCGCDSSQESTQNDVSQNGSDDNVTRQTRSKVKQHTLNGTPLSNDKCMMYDDNITHLVKYKKQIKTLQLNARSLQKKILISPN
jgi:hypothetical protein